MATYYVSNAGSDSNNGTSTGTPFLTIAKVNSITLSAGDFVLFNKGDTFVATITPHNPGTVGNIITYGAYGTGAKPIITGLTTVSAWTDLGSNIWESTSAVSTLSTLNMVVINGVNTPMGRYPNTGYLTYQTFSGAVSITSSSVNSATTNWTGAEVVIRKVTWITERKPITAHSGGTITYSGGSYSGTNNWGFFIQNDVRTLDVQNEWYYNPSTKKISVYSVGEPTGVQVSSVDRGISISSYDYITIDGLKIIGANTEGIYLNNTKKVIVQNCDIDFSGHNGINGQPGGGDCNTCTFSNNYINNTNNNSISASTIFTDLLVTGNTILNNAMIPGASDSADGSGYSIFTAGNDNIIEYNTIDGSGYIGIGFGGTGGLVRYNFVKNFCLLKQDGGGIYTVNNGAGKVISYNTVMEGYGDYSGTTDPGDHVRGIYLDQFVIGANVLYNNVANIDGAGIYFNNVSDVTANYNTVYNTNGGIYQDNRVDNTTGMDLQYNISVAKTATHKVFRAITVQDDIAIWGTLDNNYYARPIDDNLTINIVKTVPSYTDVNYSLATWQAYSGYDTNTQKSPLTITDVNQLRFEYNTTASPVVVSLPYNYMDVTGAIYNETITLQPYTSAILIQMPTYYVSNTGSDAAAGTSEATAWQTIAKVNSSSFSPGETILFKKGDMWREQLTIPSSGSVDSKITFGAYSTGAKPIINGANVVTGWTNAGSNQWWVNNPNATTTRAMVVIGGVIYNEVASLAAVNSANEYFIDTSASPDRVYVYSTVDPATLTAEISTREYCVVTAAGASSKKYIEIDDIEVRYAGRAGIYFEGPGSGGGDALDGSSIVRDCTAYANRLFGIAHYDHYDNLTVEDCDATFNGNGFYSWVADEGTFRRCTSADQIYYTIGSSSSDGHGFGGYQSNNWLVENCTSYRDNDSIRLDAGGVATNAVIRYNKVYDSKTGTPPTPGMGVGSIASGGLVQIYYNLIVNCAGAGFTVYSLISGTVQFYNNTIFLADGYGTEEGTMYLLYGTNFILKNNIFARMGADGKTVLAVINPSLPTSNYNQFYQGPLSPYRWHYNGSNYSTIALWRTGSSQDANSQSGDPLFVNQASNWSLQAGSPCINAGVSVGLTQDILGNPIVGNPDMGAYEFGSSAISFKGRNVQIV